jgi:hypothetical protein
MSLIRSIPIAAIASLAFAPLKADNVVFTEDFGRYVAGQPGAEIENFFVWSALPHPLNPTIAVNKGDPSLVLNSNLAYKTKGESTVVGSKRYADVEDAVTLYANVTAEKPNISSVGLTLSMNKEYQAVRSWSVVLDTDSSGAIAVRIDEMDNKTNARQTIATGKIERSAVTSTVALGLRLSRLTGDIEVTAARRVVATAKATIDLRSESEQYNFSLFAYNGQVCRFDDVTLILGEASSSEVRWTPSVGQ